MAPRATREGRTSRALGVPRLLVLGMVLLGAPLGGCTVYDPDPIFGPYGRPPVPGPWYGYDYGYGYGGDFYEPPRYRVRRPPPLHRRPTQPPPPPAITGRPPPPPPPIPR